MSPTIMGQPARSTSTDLDIPAGGMVGMIGPDGVDESPLMGLIAGSKKIQAGSVHVPRRRHEPGHLP